jgi:archaellum component FlaC
MSLKEIKKTIDDLKEKLDTYNQHYIRAEGQYEVIKKDLKDKYNLKPNQIDDKLDKLEKDIEKEQKELSKITEELNETVDKIEEIING